MDPKILKKTQDTLGKAIKKPPLTEKLLNKPPFRFLHDILTEVIKNTKALNGLYTPSELNSANVIDKEAKVKFLQKAIDCVGLTVGDALTARPSKIVAGQEPEKTNEFLQALGKITLKKIDTSESVKKVLAGEKPSGKKKSSSSKNDDAKEKSKDRESKEKSKEPQEVADEKQSKDKSKEKSDDKKDRERKRDKDENRERSRDRKAEVKESESREKRKDREGSGGSRSKDKEKTDRKGSSKERHGSSKGREGSSKEREGSSKEREGSTKDRDRKDKKRDKDNEKRPKDDKDAARKEKEKNREKNKERKEKSVEKPPDVNNNADNEPDDGQGSGRSIQRPASAKGQRRPPVNQDSGSEDELEGQDKENEAPPVALESKTSITSSESIQSQQEVRKQSGVRRAARPSSARPAPPRVKKQEAIEQQTTRVNSGKPVAPIIMDNKADDDDDDNDDDTFIVEEDPSLQNLLEVKSSESSTDFLNTEEHGSLVRKMLESKKEADARLKTNENNDKKPVMFDAQRKKEREMAEKEIEKLRGSIQHLVRSAHPLGKIMDYIQEDIDSMQKEMSVWKEENGKHEKALKAEQSVTESEIEPLQAHLAELELEISEMMDNISTVKSNILRNEDKIEELVHGISK